VRQFFAEPEHPYSRDVLRLQRERGSAFRLAPRTAGSQALVKAESLTKHFPVRNSSKVVQAVDKVTFEIKLGEAVGLVGESGSGKTTVGRCLMRLEKATSGQILYRGTNIASLDAEQMRKFRSKIQIVFQDPFDSVNPRWTIRQILTEPLDILTSLGRAEKRARAAHYLKLVGLDEKLLERKPRGLGAGTLQRINIARALICEPEFIVLDEPTSMLAPLPRAGLIELLVRLQQELGISYLFISHDLTTVRYLCHRVAVMYLGQIVEEGTVEEVFATPRHPYSQALLSAHLFPDPSHRRVDHPVASALQGEIPSPIDPPHGCYLSGRCPHVLPSCIANPQLLTALPDGRSVRCERVVRGEIGLLEEVRR
jgi:oligopeptide/dipeptide ABC transporter ATP-binding protein